MRSTDEVPRNARPGYLAPGSQATQGVMAPAYTRKQSVLENLWHNLGQGGVSHLFRSLANTCKADAQDAGARARTLLHILRRPRQVAHLERMLDEHGLAHITRRHTRIYAKPARPYLAGGLGMADKFNLIGSHYRVLARKFSDAGIRAMYSGRDLTLLTSTLAEMEGKVVLRHDARMDGKGELTLWLSLGEGGLFSATFVLHPHALYIGALQGHVTSRDDLRRFIRMSHGMRPHFLMLHLVRLLAGHLGLPTLRAVSNQGQHGQPERHADDLLDYDAFWRLNGGTPVDHLFFDLPLAQPRKDLAGIAEDAREESSKRYAFLDACAEEFIASLVALKA
jgi:uncharacterized protein VirK/YbjX